MSRVRWRLRSPPDPARLGALLLGHYAARELETTDPDLADVLFNVQYLVNRHWPEAAAAPTEQAPPRPDLRPLSQRTVGPAKRP